MAFGADFNVKFGLGGADSHFVAAGAGNLCRGEILRMDVSFHIVLFIISEN